MLCGVLLADNRRQVCECVYTCDVLGGEVNAVWCSAGR